LSLFVCSDHQTDLYVFESSCSRCELFAIQIGQLPELKRTSLV
jgi:hypothetical protein